MSQALMMKIKTCEVGLFKLPGVSLDKEEVTPEVIAEMDEWLKSDQGFGMKMTDYLWSFKTEAQREWFILRWAGTND